MLTEEFRAAFAYLKTLRRLLIGVAAGFLLVAILSGIVASIAFRADSALLERLMQEVTKLIGGKEIVNEQGELNASRLFLANFTAVTSSILYGLVPFLFLPMFTLLLNAGLIGVVSAAALHLGMPPAALTASLLPHGIFEIPALLLGAAIGLRLCHSLTRRIFHRPEPRFLVLVGELTRVTVLIVIPLLAVAAVIESYVTGPITSLFL